MKKAVLILFAVLILTGLAAVPAERFLVRLDRNVIALDKLPISINLFYASRNYLLTDADDAFLKSLPATAYTLLDRFPLSSKWYLLTPPGNIQSTAKPALNKIITELDGIVLVQTNLTETAIMQQTDWQPVLMDFEPVRINRSMVKAAQPSRVDFGTILNQVNADSIAWFIQQLQDFGTRNAHANNRLEVANWIRNQFLRFGIPNAQVELFNIFQNTNQYNVVATLPGTLTPEKYIIVGGHHDSIVFDGNDPLLTAPGADDNASGTAAALEIARVLKASNYQPECSIRFVTFAAEEYGLWGSKYHAQAALNQQQDIKVMINHDMIANSTTIIFVVILPLHMAGIASPGLPRAEDMDGLQHGTFSRTIGADQPVPLLICFQIQGFYATHRLDMQGLQGHLRDGQA